MRYSAGGVYCKADGTPVIWHADNYIICYPLYPHDCAKYLPCSVIFMHDFSRNDLTDITNVILATGSVELSRRRRWRPAEPVVALQISIHTASKATANTRSVIVNLRGPTRSRYHNISKVPKLDTKFFVFTPTALLPIHFRGIENQFVTLAGSTPLFEY